jgi:hypothetical protein
MPLNPAGLPDDIPRYDRKRFPPPAEIVTVYATNLDLGLYFCYQTKRESRSVKDASRVTAAGGASAVPAGEASSASFPGGSGISLPTL